MTQPDQQSSEQTDGTINGIRVDVDPDRLLAGEPTGEQVNGIRKLDPGHPAIPETAVPYFPAELPDVPRDTEETFYRALSLDKPVILEGEAGTGKNHLIRTVAATVNHPVYRQEFGAETSVFDVVGEKDLDGQGGTYYILGEAAKAAIFGGLYVADELNMATGSVTAALHPLFEDRGKRELHLRGVGRTLRDLPRGEIWNPDEHLGRYIHPDFHATATINPLHYADTAELNDALRSRCVVIEHPYLAASEDDRAGIETEVELLEAETGAPDTEKLRDLVRFAAVLREARREANAIATPIGHRELRDTVEMAGPNEEFMDFAAAARVKFVGQAAMKSDKQFIRDAIADEL
ncbi:MoxR family ATPase [Halodesulfurarchaeum sp. HSR-GB]|uniref:MoxR family ATPase n=1 Tax=Halodesulfurarchaeum sp. HSR-GB TaxID=3074077 RepID=UPI00285CAFA3|nr:MoxR family ATPase [Halodesulfurarchaeum sp. HSR-GB]MDR5655787.1 MoxR family ATPase [Halodesulfurarchaeum sp. HSR-GB]